MHSVSWKLLLGDIFEINLFLNFGLLILANDLQIINIYRLCLIYFDLSSFDMNFQSICFTETPPHCSEVYCRGVCVCVCGIGTLIFYPYTTGWVKVKFFISCNEHFSKMKTSLNAHKKFIQESWWLLKKTIFLFSSF